MAQRKPLEHEFCLVCYNLLHRTRDLYGKFRYSVRWVIVRLEQTKEGYD
jgi:hypothetical protein